MKIVKNLTNCYNKLSTFGKILVFISLLLIVLVFFRTNTPANRESFNVDMTSNKFLFKQGMDVYDDFYANIYDYLVFNEIKNDYEVGNIMNNILPSEKSLIADIGSGTGSHVAKLTLKGLDVIGVDISPSMIQKAKENYPSIAPNFKLGDALDAHLFKADSLTHILCLYFTIYYMKDKMRFFYNCMNWLMPGGYLIIHLVDKYKIDSILPSENNLYTVSPLNSKHQITTRQIKLKDLVYNSNFKLQDNNTAIFEEDFKFNDGRVRKQTQQFYMEDLPTIVNMAQNIGFLLHAKLDMIKCGYEYQYLYVFVKPS